MAIKTCLSQALCDAVGDAGIDGWYLGMFTDAKKKKSLNINHLNKQTFPYIFKIFMTFL